MPYGCRWKLDSFLLDVYSSLGERVGGCFVGGGGGGLGSRISKMNTGRRS